LDLQHFIRTAQRPFLIAGPCSAETEEQVMQTCQQIAASGQASALRAGIWKPRTRPDSFEGLGEEALPWLIEAGKSVGLPVAVEVANRTHAETALKAGVNILWIGARTTVNPFAVQEIADVLKGTNVPVMIKNPVNPDLELWLGAFERFEKAGLTDLVAIHRGFSVYKHPKYRNVPSWEIPIGLRERRPDLPLICDPSHITGNRTLLHEVAQKAMDLNFDGLMIEAHVTPDEAWSDAAQQITPYILNELIHKLILRSGEVSESAADLLREMRAKVSNLDDRIFELIAARMQISDEVGQLKRENNITILQQEHWAKIIHERLERDGEYGLSKDFIRKLMDAIHQESIRHQVKVMNK
jgi:chorismate mutase